MTEYYVHGTLGNDGNAGTGKDAAAWKTVNKAVTTVVAGDIVYIQDSGPYGEGGLVFANGGTVANPITLRNYPGDTPVLGGDGVNTYIIRGGGNPYLIFDGLDFEWRNGKTGNAFMIQLASTADDDAIIRNCRFYDEFHGTTPKQVYDAGYRTRAIQVLSDRVEVDNCEFWNLQHGTILQTSHTAAWIHDNHYHEMYQQGVLPKGDYTFKGTVIEDNLIENSYIEDGIQFEPEDQVSYSNVGYIIRNNIIRNNAENAIDLKGCTNVFIEGNIFYGTVGSSDGPEGGGWNRESLGVIMKGSNVIMKDITIRHNIFFDNCSAVWMEDGFKVYNNIFISNNRDYRGSDQQNDGANKGDPYALGNWHGGDNQTIINNIFANHNEFEVSVQFGDPAIDIDNNLYIDGAVWADWNANDDWVSYFLLDDWRAKIQQGTNYLSAELNSIQVASFAEIDFLNVPANPDNVTGDHTQFDFRLSVNSPARDAGRWITRANGAGAADTALVVDDARVFRPDWGNIAGVAGDTIIIAGQTRAITAINYGTNTITLDQATTWNNNDPVYLPYNGVAPDIGVYEYEGELVGVSQGTSSAVGTLNVVAPSTISGSSSGSAFSLGSLTLDTERVMNGVSAGISSTSGALTIPQVPNLQGVSQGSSQTIGKLSGVSEVIFPDRLALTVYMNLRDSTNVLSFNGTTANFVDAKDFPLSSIEDGFAIETWFSSSILEGTICHLWDSEQSTRFGIRDPGSLRIDWVDGLTTYNTFINVADGAPHHLALILDGTTLKLYIDAKLRWSLDNVDVAPTLPVTKVFDLGVFRTSTGGFVSPFSGNMWDFRIWGNNVRSESEILDYMNHRLVGDETGLALYWKMDEGSGTTLVDSTGGTIPNNIGSEDQWTTAETQFFTDLTDYIDADNVRWSSVLGQLVDSFSFEFDGWYGQKPSEWDEVVVLDGETRLFGGFCTSVNEFEGDNADPAFWVGCSDYGIYLDHARVSIEEFENRTDVSIIQSILNEHVPWIGTNIGTNMHEIRLYDRIRFLRKPIRSIINQLADYGDGHWYISENRECFFFEVYYADAPFTLTDRPNLSNSFPYHGLVKQKGGAKLTNRVDIIGGRYLNENDQTFILQGTGEDQRIIMPFHMRGPVAGGPLDVFRNDAYPATNYIANPSFENNIADHWNTFQNGVGGSWSQDSSHIKHGTQAAKITAGDEDRTALYTDDETNPIVVNDEQTVFLTAWVWSAAQNRARLRIYDVTNGVFRKTGSNDGGGSDWVQLRLKWTNNTGNPVTIRAYLENTAGDGTTEMWFDGVMLTKDIAFVPAYVDGDQEDCEWSGVAHSSSSFRDALADPIWVELETLVGHVDELEDYDQVLHYQEDKVLETLDPWPLLEDACRIYGRNEIPLRTRVRDRTSFEYYGKWFDDVIVDENIVSKETAKTIGKSHLARFSMGTTTITVNCREPGLRSGERLRLVSSKHDIDDYFLIQRIDGMIGPWGRPKYALSLGLWNDDLIALLLKLNRETETDVEYREDEVLDEVLLLSEVVEISETTPAPTASSPPYRWDEAKWDQMIWDSFFRGKSQGFATCSGTLTTALPQPGELRGASGGVGSAFGYITESLEMAGVSDGETTAFGDLYITPPNLVVMNGVSTGSSAASGNLGKTFRIQGESQGSSAGSGDLSGIIEYVTISAADEISDFMYYGLIADSTGYLYCFLLDGTNNYELACYRSSDGGATWAEQDAANRPTTTGANNLDTIAIASEIRNDRIYIATIEEDTIHFHTFVTNQSATNKDTWDVTDQLVVTVADISTDRELSIAVGDSANDIIIVSGGDVTGRTYDRCVYHYSTDGGTNWTTEQALDDGSDTRHKYAQWVRRGPVTGDIYALWQWLQAAVGPYMRYADDVDQAFSGAKDVEIADADKENIHDIAIFEVYQSGTEEHCVVIWPTDNNLYPRSTYIVDQGTPAASKLVTATTIYSDEAGSDLVVYSLAVDGTDVYLVYVDNATRDIWYSKNEDNGNWGTPKEIVDGQTADRVQATIFEYNSKIYLGVVWVHNASGGDVRFHKKYLRDIAQSTLAGVSTGTSSATGALTVTGQDVSLQGVSSGSSTASGALTGASNWYLISSVDEMSGFMDRNFIGDSTGYLYAFLKDGTNNDELVCYRSSDGGKTWAEQDAVNRPSTSGTNINAIAIAERIVGDKIYIATISNNGDIYFHTFIPNQASANKDTWDTTDKLVVSIADMSGDYELQIAIGDSADDIIIVSGGDVTGRTYDRCVYHYSTDGGTNWTTEQALDDGSDTRHKYANCVMRGPRSGDIYAVWQWLQSSVGLYLRTATDVDQTFSGATAKDLRDQDKENGHAISQMIVYDDGAEEHCIVVWPTDNTHEPRSTFVIDDGTPDVSEQVSAKGIYNASNRFHHTITSDGNRAMYVFIDAGTQDIWAVDNTSDGGWTNEREILDNVTGLQIHAQVFEYTGDGGTKWLGIVYRETGDDVRFIKEKLS